MGQGGNKTERIDIIDNYDPRITGRAATKGTLFRFIPVVGDPELLIKQDEGFTINWISASGGGGTPTGDPNTQAYFDALGNLSDNVDAKFNELKNAIATGAPAQTGLTDATGDASESHGEAIGVGSTIVASGDGAEAFGQTLNDGDITAVGIGSEAYGLADGAGSLITATNIGGTAFGNVIGGGNITASGPGALAFGDNSGATILSSGQGSTAFGFSTGILDVIAATNRGALSHGYTEGGGGDVTASGEGSHAHGRGSSGTVAASGIGSHAHGRGTNIGAVTASGVGSTAHGESVSGGSIITASGVGSRASGSTVAGGGILATGIGADAYGFVDGGFSISAGAVASHASGYAASAGISALGSASFVRGFADDAFNISSTALAVASVVIGKAQFQAMTVDGVAAQAFGNSHLLNGNYSTAFGVGHTSTSYASVLIGRFGLLAETAVAWVPTEAALALGNGTAVGAEAIGYRLDKDGRQLLTASELNSAIRMVAAADAISERTDYAIVFDTAGAGGALTLPAGINGQKFLFMPAGVGAAVYTLTPNGGDLLDANVTALLVTGVTQGLMFLGGTWYSSTN